jgi:hypothetical protein
MQSLKKVSALGVITGSIVAILGRLIVTFVVGLVIGIQIAASGSEVPTNFGYTPVGGSITFLVMSLFSILGGYTAAAIAKHDELLNGALSSLLAMLWAFCSLFTDPLYLAILTLLTTPLLAALGGYLRFRQMAHKQPPLPGGQLETDMQRQEAQPEQSPVDRSGKSKGRAGKPSPLILLGGIAIVVGLIWCLWFGWSLASFTAPGFLILLGYGIFRLFRKR